MKNRHDYYFKKAKQDDYPARSVYKLEEGVKKFNFIKPTDLVLDVGSTPGSWSKYMLDKILTKGSVVGVDLIETKLLHPRFKFVLGEIERLDLNALGGIQFNVVVSDAMPNTTSDKDTNHFRSIALARKILALVSIVLKDGGNFFIKVYDGSDLPDFKRALASNFEKVTILKPKSSRDESREIFVFASNKRGKL